jgi:predicted MFS family arabinose efflux permease
LITGTAKPENRGSFLSFNSAVQQLGAGIASFFAGLVLTESVTGELVNFEIIGYIAIVLSLLCIPLIRRIKVIDVDDKPLIIQVEESQILK